MGMLAGTFNVMTKDLEAAKKKVDNWTQTLEEEIAKKTDELEESQDKLIQSEKLAALGRLTSDVAHRIRNPLTSIGGFAHKLERIVKGDKEREYTGIVVTEVTRLEKILRDVLTFSREAGLRFERNSAKEVVRDVSSLYRNMCNDQSVHMEVTIEENLPLVLMDKNQAKQAFGNLLANALDAMPGGGMLSIRACREELHNAIFLSIKVSDTGAGIPKEKLHLIFEPFFSTMGMYGTGLGLSITRKIMEEHGGFITAESAVGKGSTFSLYFPYQSDEESLKIKCWEFKTCGRDKDAAIKCPAFPNFGRICWAVAGTFCEGKAQGTFAQKYNDCRKCEFYRKVKSREA
jgi:signal transduction histidine kinase